MIFANLSTGCLAHIVDGVECGKPVMQVLGTKRIPGKDGSARYRILVSDGKYIISCVMLATQLNSYADENKLTDNTIIRVDKHIVSVLSEEVIVGVARIMDAIFNTRIKELATCDAMRLEAVVMYPRCFSYENAVK